MAKVVGRGEDGEIVLFYSKENQKRRDNNISNQIWTHWIKQFTIHYRET